MITWLKNYWYKRKLDKISKRMHLKVFYTTKNILKMKYWNYDGWTPYGEASDIGGSIFTYQHEGALPDPNKTLLLITHQFLEEDYV